MLKTNAVIPKMNKNLQQWHSIFNRTSGRNAKRPTSPVLYLKIQACIIKRITAFNTPFQKSIRKHVYSEDKYDTDSNQRLN